MRVNYTVFAFPFLSFASTSGQEATLWSFEPQYRHSPRFSLSSAMARRRAISTGVWYGIGEVAADRGGAEDWDGAVDETDKGGKAAVEA